MTIHLPKDIEKIVHDAVRAGRYANENEMIRDALLKLDQAMPKPSKEPVKKAKSSQAIPANGTKPLTPDELDEYMLSVGLMTKLPDSTADYDDPDDEPITLRGEPLSETVIRERR